MSPIKNTKLGYTSLFTGKVETYINPPIIKATYTANDNFQPGNGYQYIVFTSPGNLYVTRSGPVDILVIGGGGGGGDGEYHPPSTRYSGGGGGAGGFLEKFQVTLPIGDYDISIGAGGARGANNTSGQPGTTRNGSSGTPSYISGPTITDLIGYGGGGGGGSFDAPSKPAGNGSDGGSGGGTSQSSVTVVGEGNRTTAAAPSTGSPIPSYLQGLRGKQGNPGGSSPSTGESGGGGGASKPGIIPGLSLGGDGLPAWSDDDGIPSSYGTPGPTPGRWFAGGGGGAGTYTVPFENGGAGGGGRGAEDAPPGGTQASTAGTINTGGGGGGGHEYGRSSPGGSGIVIIRYRMV